MKWIYPMLRPIARRYPWIARMYRDARDGRALNAAPRRTPFGFLFSGHPAMEAGTFEPAEAEIIRQHLQTSDVFINVGANIGYYCCMALQQKVQTVAFEPIELNLKYLYKNTAANGWQDAVEIYPLAVGSRIGLIEIYGGGTSASLIQGWAKTPEYYRRWVPITTLDTAVGSRFAGKRCLLLVDIEGAEKALLDGACHLLNLNPRPVWIVEVCITEHMPQGVKVNPDLVSVFRIFADCGYKAWTCGQSVRPVEMNEVEAVASTGRNTFGTHNFMFKAESDA